MIEEMEAMIIERLQLWSRRNNNRLPEKLIVYRDGVSEGISSPPIPHVHL